MHHNNNSRLNELIRKRRSIRAFSDEEITAEDLTTILEAATWAPSSMNEQPWRYLYARKGTAGYARLWNCLADANKTWTANAAALIVCVARKNFSRNGKPNRHYMHDCGLANENLFVQAISMNIYTHAMGGFDMERTKNELQVPADEEVVCFIALGYAGDPSQLEEPNRSRESAPRTRKSVEEVSTEIA
ncbi:MAG: nitroreductase family protein [Flavipsychrobacter sp.]|nr:nitroreductase family protein [Flavipsychrobacter sp.]